MRKRIDELRPHPANERVYGAEELPEGFVASIRKQGILVPLAVTKDGVIISGHRRWRAAMAIGLDTVPVQAVSYADDLAEREALIAFNRQREKTFSQKMAEAEELEAIERERARQRMSEAAKAQRQGMETFPHPEKGAARDKVASTIGIGSGRTYDKAAKVWAAAKQGDKTAEKAVEELDAGETTIHAAYKAITEKQATPHVIHNSGNNEWYTPSEYIEAAGAVMGGIDLDPASTAEANKIVKATRFYDVDDDGLQQPWVGRVWLNPPYSSDLIGRFCDRLAEHIASGAVPEAIVLVNNATETAWFNTLISSASAVVFPRGRVKFWGPHGQTGAPLQGQALIYCGPSPATFLEVFACFGWGARL